MTLRSSDPSGQKPADILTNESPGTEMAVEAGETAFELDLGVPGTPSVNGETSPAGQTRLTPGESYDVLQQSVDVDGGSAGGSSEPPDGLNKLADKPADMSDDLGPWGGGGRVLPFRRRTRRSCRHGPGTARELGRRRAVQRRYPWRRVAGAAGDRAKRDRDRRQRKVGSCPYRRLLRPVPTPPWPPPWRTKGWSSLAPLATAPALRRRAAAGPCRCCGFGIPAAITITTAVFKVDRKTASPLRAGHELRARPGSQALHPHRTPPGDQNRTTGAQPAASPPDACNDPAQVNHRPSAGSQAACGSTQITQLCVAHGG